jgi:arsenite methyltransferase
MIFYQIRTGCPEEAESISGYWCLFLRLFANPVRVESPPDYRSPIPVSFPLDLEIKIRYLYKWIVLHQELPMAEETCCLESCDMFDFMSEHVGRNILHPGGRKASDALIDLLQLDRNKTVLDVACGKGLTSVAVAKKYGCKVVGVDILEKSIEKARAFAVKHGVEHLVEFKVADAQKLPFTSNRFDATIAQAMLILVDDKIKAVREINRVLKPGGRSAWLELSWRKKTTKEFIERASKEICAACIARVDTFEGWQKTFKKGGVKNLRTQKNDLISSGVRGMFEDEGPSNGMAILFRMATRPSIRKRMNGLSLFFKTYREYLGYGIYSGSK